MRERVEAAAGQPLKPSCIHVSDANKHSEAAAGGILRGFGQRGSAVSLGELLPGGFSGADAVPGQHDQFDAVDNRHRLHGMFKLYYVTHEKQNTNPLIDASSTAYFISGPGCPWAQRTVMPLGRQALAGYYGVPGGPAAACPAGSYCPAGSTAPAPCPAHTTGPAISMDSSACQVKMTSWLVLRVKGS